MNEWTDWRISLGECWVKSRLHTLDSLPHKLVLGDVTRTTLRVGAGGSCHLSTLLWSKDCLCRNQLRFYLLSGYLSRLLSKSQGKRKSVGSNCSASTYFWLSSEVFRVVIGKPLRSPAKGHGNLTRLCGSQSLLRSLTLLCSPQFLSQGFAPKSSLYSIIWRSATWVDGFFSF